MTKPKVRKVKAWAVCRDSLREGVSLTFPIYRTKKEPLNTIRVYGLKGYQVFPVTIIYAIPKPSKKKL